MFHIEKHAYLWYHKDMKTKQMNKDLSAMSRDELEQNIVELTTQVESQKQKIRWLQEQFNLLQQKRFGTSSEKDMGSGEQMSLFNEAEWTADEAEGQIPEPDMAKVAPPKKTKTKGGKLRMVSGLDPFRYLVYIFEKLSQDEDYDLEQLMPWTEAVASTCKADSGE